MNNYLKAIATFFLSIASLLSMLLTALLFLYFGYLMLVLGAILTIIFLIKQLYDAKDDLQG